jgi:hypothetical protein
MPAPLRFSRLASQLQALAPLPAAPPPDAPVLSLASLQALATKAKPPKKPTPFLTPHDHAALLLRVAAEVEHALMVEYLYAGFSLNETQAQPEHQSLVREWRQVVMGIAREEMGHLVTVQNLLQLIGAPLTLRREDMPFDNDLQPFTFRLEPLSKVSLAKYVVAEMPSQKFLEEKQPELWKELQPIIELAQQDNGGRQTNQVGLIYEQLQDVFDELSSADIQASSLPYQASASVWGLGYREILVETAYDRQSAKASMLLVSEQGEGDTIDQDAAATPSHFERFLAIYRAFPADGSWAPAKPLPTDPTTQGFDWHALPAAEGTALIWATLSNQRYRMVLLYLLHALHVEAAAGSTHGLLVSWTFGEMYNLRSISDILTTQPSWDKPAGQCAASPFEMPYSLDLPDRPADRWRLHRDQLQNSRLLVDHLRHGAHPAHQKYLDALLESDAKTLTIINGMIGA